MTTEKIREYVKLYYNYLSVAKQEFLIDFIQKNFETLTKASETFYENYQEYFI